MVRFTPFIIAAVYASTVVAKCFSDEGDACPTNKEEAYYHIRRACYGYEVDGKHVKGRFENVYFKPYWESPYPATLCVNRGHGSFNFAITNLNGVTGFTLKSEDCYKRLAAEISGCGYGGESDTAGWRFKSDCNAALC
ncbi:hypothetical protein DL98DRAFT_513561 [Cadophora sp. DSE1049]|nr:hypothetical protein DL98DRAFT_513561 [Cadophora sp. DSE1049]